jgi:hypothetical protein
MPDYGALRVTGQSACVRQAHGGGESAMRLHEIAALRDAAREMYARGKLLTTGEALTGACWGLLIVLCVLQAAAGAFLG